jgi:hypothetical protein
MPGGQHDSTIFTTSPLYHKLKEERLLKGLLIVADSAYKTTLPFLATPFLDAVAAEDPRKRIYNTAHARARVSVEQGIGQLKKRWPILTGDGIRYPSMIKAAKMIQVLVGLHNYILHHSKDDDAESLESYLVADDSDMDHPEIEEDELETEIVNGRRRIIPTCEKILEKYFP